MRAAPDDGRANETALIRHAYAGQVTVVAQPLRIMPTLRQRYSELEHWSPPLAKATVASLLLFVIAAVGFAVDQRVITGAPAWLKPMKFGASGVVYLFTIAWMVRELPQSRMLRVASNLIAWILVLEVVLIHVQATRGTTSHFNINTPLDTAIFSTMGLGIATVWVMSMVVLWLHVRTRATDRNMAIALRLGMALNILGAGVGWTMTQPRPAQLAAMQRGARPRVAGSHTVGAPDGGAGLPVTLWSREHGDLRVPHFLGMHALQLLPLLVLGLRRVRRSHDDGTERTSVLFVAALSAAIFAAALMQALAGHPLIPSTG